MFTGIFGYITSAFFVSEKVSCGLFPATFDFFSFELVQLWNSWKYHVKDPTIAKRDRKKRMKLLTELGITFLLSFLPNLDNWQTSAGSSSASSAP